MGRPSIPLGYKNHYAPITTLNAHRLVYVVLTLRATKNCQAIVGWAALV